MADSSDSRESDNNSWVIPGSEVLPVSDLGAEAVDETQGEAELAKDGSQHTHVDRKEPMDQTDLGEAKLEDPGVVLGATPEEAPPSPGLLKTPELVLLEPDPLSFHISPQEAEAGPISGPQGPPLIHKAGPLEQQANASSSEDEAAKERDVEGLRRRKGRDTHVVPPGAPRDWHRAALGGEENALPGTKWLLGLLAILGLGLLAFSGVIFDLEGGPVDVLSTWQDLDGVEPDRGADGKDGSGPTGDAKFSQAKEALTSEAPSDTQSLDAMGQLLDKLAKENQDIRLMQAELQAQKEELQIVLRKTEGEALESTSQQQNLATENARLAEALRRETSALLEAQAELRLLRQKLQALGEAGEAKSHRRGKEAPTPQYHPHPHHRDRAEAPEAEIRRLRSLLESVRRDLASALQKAPPGNGSKKLQAELSEVDQRLARELQQAEGDEGAKPSWRESHKARRGKERAWRKRHEGQEEPRPGQPEEEPAKGPGDHHPAHKAPKGAGDGPHRPRKHRAQDAKLAKDREHQQVGRKAKKPLEPGALWEMLRQHRFPPPQGCAGVAECAQQEGVAPVQKTTFLQVLQRYLTGVGWAEHYGGVAAALDGFFDGEGSVFAHDRRSFVDFLDEVEDALEELAQYLGGSEEEADNFEEVVLRQLGRAPGGRFMQQNPKEQSHEGPGHKNGREGTARAHR